MSGRWYVLKLKAVPTRYRLSRNVQELLQCLEHYHEGSCDALELGRVVRLSPKRRTAIADTITKCAGIMKREPEETKTCLEVIEMCSELLELADRKPPIDSFPFMRLPQELRDRILTLIVDNVFRFKSIVPSSRKTYCGCPRFDRDLVLQTAQMRTLPSTLGRSLQHEFFRIFYSSKTFRFRCSCELYNHLARNERLLDHVQHVSVHWCGPDSVEAFRMLAKCPQLERLTVTISKSTFVHLSRRANLFRSFFPVQYRNPRITDVMGLDELMELRGLREVEVTRAGTGGGGSTMSIEMDRANMAELLVSRLLLPKPPDYQQYYPIYY